MIILVLVISTWKFFNNSVLSEPFKRVQFSWFRLFCSRLWYYLQTLQLSTSLRFPSLTEVFSGKGRKFKEGEIFWRGDQPTKFNLCSVPCSLFLWPQPHSQLDVRKRVQLKYADLNVYVNVSIRLQQTVTASWTKALFFPFSLGLKVLFYGRFRKIRRWKPWWTFKLGRRTLRVRRAGRYQVKVQNVWFFLRRKKGRWSAKFKGRSYRVVTRGSNFFLRKNRRLIPLIYFRIHFRGAWRPLRFRKKKMFIRYKRQWRKMRSKFVYRVRVKGRYYTALRKGKMFSIRNHGRWRGWTPAYRRKWSGMTVMVCTAW